MGAWQAAAFFVLSVSAWYILRNKHLEMAKASMRIGIVIACFASIMQLITGHISGTTLAETQPAKLAAFEGHFLEDAPAGLYLFGWVDEESETTRGLQLPGLLSYLVHGDSNRPVTSLSSFPPEDRPPVNAVFQSFHLMVAIGFLLILLSGGGLLAMISRRLFATRWLLWIFVLAVLLPQAGNQLGWFAAEVGRQPWIVYGLLRTSDALSKSVDAVQVKTSLLMFGFIYLLLFALFVYLLNEKIQQGPDIGPSNQEASQS
jgi:cytochrome d ubiquinol oxidase subunit I